ncbi:MAG: polyphosphate kinase 2 family protein [Gammaproteobacteria bacterium]
MNHARLRVSPDTRVDLAKRDPSDRTGVPSDKVGRVARLREISAEIDALQDRLYAGQRHRVLMVLQGMDTSGKDGTIRHVFSAVDPLGVRAHSFRAPAGEELQHGYLWRIHRQVPRAGELVIFNRSHYEDVLVVRVHGRIDAEEVRRRLRQIREFEQMLADTGTVIVKFFLHISRDEQRRRLQDRLDDPNKRWKFDPGDLHERAHWDAYMAAYEEALGATSRPWAPWYIIPSDSKSTRNLLVSTVLRDRLNELGLEYPQPVSDYGGLVIE